MPTPAALPQGQAPLQRTAINRQHARRSGQFAPKLAPGSAQAPQDSFVSRSPQGQPTPSSHASSPTNPSTRSPIAMQQGGMTPPASAVQTQQQQYQFRSQPPPNQHYVQHVPQQRPPLPSQYQSASSGMSSASTSASGNMMGNPSYGYPSPFQKHIDQLGKLTPPLSPLPNRTMFVLD